MCYFSSAVVRSYQYLWSAVVTILLRACASCRHVLVYHMYDLGLQSMSSFAHPYRVRQTKLLSKLKIQLHCRAVRASKPLKCLAFSPINEGSDRTAKPAQIASEIHKGTNYSTNKCILLRFFSVR